jgi:hypothetical protein
MHRASVSAGGGAKHQAGGSMHGELGAAVTVAQGVEIHDALGQGGV